MLRLFVRVGAQPRWEERDDVERRFEAVLGAGFYAV